MSDVPVPASGNDLRAAGMGSRVAVSIVSVFGFAIFLLLYFAFWSGSFTVGQSVVLVIVALLVFIATNGAAWASWGARWYGGPGLETKHA